MKYFMGIVFGTLTTALIKVGIKCTELYMVFSPAAMWAYIAGCLVDGFLSTRKKSKIYA